MFTRGVEATRDHFTSVPRVAASSLTPLLFLRRYVVPSRPVILLGAASHWPALAHWGSAAYLSAAAGSATVTLSRTPNGRADACEQDGSFYLPHNESCSFEHALQVLRGGPAASCGTPYLSAQDDCLRRQLPQLARDVGAVLVAEEALGACDAQNIWVAPPTAGPGACPRPPVSSLHKDYYENLVTVVEGAKTFTLLPPTDAAFLHVRQCPVRRYVHSSAGCSGSSSCSSAGCWGSEAMPGDPVPWVPVDFDAPLDTQAHPLAAHASPVRVTLHKGETLYLPALWYHQVGVAPGQSGLTISVNSWFEMEFGVSHVAQQMMLGVGEAAEAEAAAE